MLEAATAHLIARLAAVAITGAVLLFAYRLVVRVITRLLRDRPGHEAARLRTFASLLTSLTRWVVGFVAAAIVLRELGVDVLPVLVSAGVLGLAIGFGAQALIRDVIAGLTVRVAPERRLAAEAELRRRIKVAFDREHWPPFGAAG